MEAMDYWLDDMEVAIEWFLIFLDILLRSTEDLTANFQPLVEAFPVVLNVEDEVEFDKVLDGGLHLLCVILYLYSLLNEWKWRK